MVGELDQIAGVLCVDNLLELMRAGGSDPSGSVASFFASYLERGELCMVAEATPVELDACQRLMPGFASLFQVVRIDPLEPDAAYVVLNEVADMVRGTARIECAAGVAGAVQHLFRRFMPYHPFPGRSVRFVRELFRKVAREGAPEVTVEHVITEFLRQTGLPEFLLRDELPLDPEDVRLHFKRRIRGQPAACDAVARLVVRFKAGLNDPQRPLGVMLFCGPTGVGKTALAKALADYLFGSGRVGGSSGTARHERIRGSRGRPAPGPATRRAAERVDQEDSGTAVFGRAPRRDREGGRRGFRHAARHVR